jgi:hypothetical protein
MTKDLEKKYQNLNKKRRYELLNYDKKRHLELLNKQGDEFKSKLRTYSIILIDHLNWEIRDQYLELLDNYMEAKIDSFNFIMKFEERYDLIEKVANLLKSNQVLLSPDQNSLDFGDFLSEIESCCKAYSDNPEPFQQKFELGEVEFRISIEKIYLKIQNFLNQE